MKKRIVLLFGASGSGKTTLGTELKKLGYVEIVGSTTRAPREGEKEGKDYYFLTEEEFDKTEMVESAIYSGNKYGTQKKEIINKLENHDKIFAVVEKNGVKAFKEKYPDLVTSIFIYAPLDILKQRMIQRKDTPESIEKRLKNFEDSKELNNINLADYVIVNKNSIEESLKLLKFILGE